MDYSRQCILERKVTNGVERQVSWIPEVFVKLHKYLRLLNDGHWENGWEIVGIGGRMSRQQTDFHANDHKRQRRASDIERGTREPL